GEAEICELADAGAGEGVSAAQGDYGDAHPEGIEAGGVAVVGEGIEHDVDVVIVREVGAGLGAVDEVEAVGGNALRSEGGGDASAGEAGGGEKGQLGV